MYVVCDELRLIHVTMCRAAPENIHTHPKEDHWKFEEGGWGVLKAIIFKVKYEARLEMPGGEGFKPINLLWGGGGGG